MPIIKDTSISHAATSFGASTSLTDAVRGMAERGETGGCVYFAFKDAGLPVTNGMIMSAIVRPINNPQIVATELGLEPANVSRASLKDLHRDLEKLQTDGIFPFILIGVPQGQFHITQHINFLSAATVQSGQPAFKLGGIPPFGPQAGDTFEIAVLEKLVPSHGILMFKKKGG